MLNWTEFLKEGYGITQEEFNELSDYEKRIIEREYESMWKGYLW